MPHLYQAFDRLIGAAATTGRPSYMQLWPKDAQRQRGRPNYRRDRHLARWHAAKQALAAPALPITPQP